MPSGAALAPSVRRGNASAGVPKATFRPDIQGLRTIAVLAVLVYHLNPEWLPGGFVGVDVFFVISGFLITGILIRQLETRGYVSIGEFYGRRAKRLLPAAALVLLATTLLTFTFLPETRWESIGWDVIASAFYVENWRLAGSSVDYLQLDTAPSPLQHFWSLGVEEQFYFVWPFLLIVVGLLFARGRKSRRHGITSAAFRPMVLVALAVVAVPSFIWSIIYTNSNPGPAYFVTTTRVWELAVGAMVAAAVIYIGRLPRAALAIMGWLGIVGIGASVMFIGPAVPYPGSAALLPTVSTALVIAGGVVSVKAGPEIVLGIRPAVFIGDISYSLYLWHWPLIIVATALLGQIDLIAAAVLAALSVVLAWASYKFVERPLNESNVLSAEPAKALTLGLILTLVAGLTGSALVFQARDNQAAAAVSGYVPKPVGGTEVSTPDRGALVLPESPRGTEPVDQAESITPDPLVAIDDRTDCQSATVDETEIKSCVFGAETGVNVALVGDSHAQQWIPALELIAEDNDWRVTTYLHDACPFATGELIRDFRRYSTCIDWNASVLDQLSSDSSLGMVITSNYTDSVGVEDGSMAEAHASSWQRIADAGIPVAVIRDSPNPGINVPECVSQNTASLSACAISRAEAVDDRGIAQIEASEMVEGVTLIDVNDWICPGDMCAPVIGDVLVYRDANHLTATYVETLATVLSDKLTPVIR